MGDVLAFGKRRIHHNSVISARRSLEGEEILDPHVESTSLQFGAGPGIQFHTGDFSACRLQALGNSSATGAGLETQHTWGDRRHVNHLLGQFRWRIERLEEFLLVCDLPCVQ